MGKLEMTDTSVEQPMPNEEPHAERPTMDALWTRHESWLTSNYPDGLLTLNDGASVAELSTLEKTLGQQLPDDYRSWLSSHNGDNGNEAGLLWSNEFMSTDRVASQWQMMVTLSEQNIRDIPTESDPKGHIVPVWWHRHWIPITSDGAGNLECLDLTPGPNGTIGQIIDYDNETIHRTVLASSFREWISEFVERVEAGEYGYSQDYGRLMPFEEM